MMTKKSSCLLINSFLYSRQDLCEYFEISVHSSKLNKDGECSQVKTQSIVNHALWSGDHKFESPLPYSCADISKKKKRIRTEKQQWRNELFFRLNRRSKIWKIISFWCFCIFMIFVVVYNFVMMYVLLIYNIIEMSENETKITTSNSVECRNIWWVATMHAHQFTYINERIINH